MLDMEKYSSQRLFTAETFHLRFSRLNELFLLIKRYQSPSYLIVSVELISLQLTEFCQVAFLACYKALICSHFQLEKWSTSAKRSNDAIRFIEI